MPRLRSSAEAYAAFSRVVRLRSSVSHTGTANSSTAASFSSAASGSTSSSGLPPDIRSGSRVSRCRCTPYRRRSSVSDEMVSPPYSGARPYARTRIPAQQQQADRCEQHDKAGREQQGFEQELHAVILYRPRYARVRVLCGLFEQPVIPRLLALLGGGRSGLAAAAFDDAQVVLPSELHHEVVHDGILVLQSLCDHQAIHALDHAGVKRGGITQAAVLAELRPQGRDALYPIAGAEFLVVGGDALNDETIFTVLVGHGKVLSGTVEGDETNISLKPTYRPPRCLLECVPRGSRGCAGDGWPAPAPRP